MRIKQSFCYPLYLPADNNLETAIKAAAEIGYAAVELWARPPEFEELMGLAKRYGLAVASMSGHMSLPDGLNKRSNHDRIEAELRESIDIAVQARHPRPDLLQRQSPAASERDRGD